jgi:hypothetical protein
MSHHKLLPSVVAVALTGCAGFGSSSTSATTTSAISRECPPAAPVALAVPPDNELAFSLHATGVQIYNCSPLGKWTFTAPDATLFDGNEVAGIHYAGPTWESVDGSKVVGSKLAAATVDATAIPWLLLSAVSHAGPGVMAEVTFIQRLQTSGGLAPSGACTSGAVARVPYSATYYFYQAGNSGRCQ